MAGSPFEVIMNTGGIAGTNCFLIADTVAKVAVLFDAPDHTVVPLLDQAQQRGWDVIGLWLTHGHFDHTADHEVVTNRFPNAKVLIHPLDEPKLQNPKIMRFELPFTIPPRSADGYLTDGQHLAIGSLKCEVIFTPGHAPGHVMFYFPAEKLLVGGDLIIGGSVGRTDLPDSSHGELNKSIRRVMQLPGDVILLPGHGQPSKLEDEMRENEFVQEAMRSR